MTQPTSRQGSELVVGSHFPLLEVQRLMALKLNQPKSYRVSASALLSFPKRGKRIWMNREGIDRKKRQFVICQEWPDPETGKDELHMDFIDVNDLSVKKTLVFDDLTGQVEIHRNNVTTLNRLLEVVFLDDAHLGLGLADGQLRVVRIADGTTINQIHLGGTMPGLDVAGGMLAVSLFPRADTAGTVADLGIKVFSVASLVSGQPAEPIHAIHPFFLNILPRTIRFNHDASALICLEGAMLNPGFTNTVEIVGLNSYSKQTLVREDDHDLSVSISGMSDQGTCCLRTRDAYAFIRPDGKLAPQGQLPKELQSCGAHPVIEISPDGQVCLMELNGRLFITAPGRTPQPCLQELGWVSSMFFIDTHTIFCLICNGHEYDLAQVDLKSRKIINAISRPSRPRIEPLSTNAFDVTADGALVIGDHQGNLRLFDPALSRQRVLPTHNGTIRVIARDPHENRMAVLWHSHKMRMFYPEETVFRPHMGGDLTGPIDAGSGCRSISFLPRNGRPWRWSNESSIAIGFENGRYVACGKGKTTCGINTWTYHKNSHTGNTTYHRDFKLHSPAVGSADLYEKAAILLEDGALCIIDPWNVDDPPEALPQTQLIVSPEPLQGMYQISDRRVAVWTGKTLTVLDIQPDWESSVREQKDVAGIHNIKWDPVGRRYLIAFDYYLGCYAADLQEMHRLYLLTGGEYLIRVPYPAHLQHGLCQSHPGYVWCSTPAGRQLLEVLDAQGHPITTPMEREAFLDDYWNEFMVREALADYRGFCAGLAAGQDEQRFGMARTHLSLPSVAVSRERTSSAPPADPELGRVTQQVLP